jgi:hypothetical protein
MKKPSVLKERKIPDVITINRFVVEHNAEPKPFIWTADPNKIIQAVRRAHQVLDSVH